MFFRILIFSSLIATTLSAAPTSRPLQDSASLEPLEKASLVQNTYAAKPKTVDTDAIVQSANAFGIELMKPLLYFKSNAIFSPFSVFSCLSMVASGAEGKTKELMEKVLHWPYDRNKVAKAVGALNKQIFVSSSGEKCSLILNNANALFAEADTDFLPPFSHLIEEDYQADLQSIDFSQSVSATELINTWVSETTNNKIKKLIELGDIDAATRLVLINAIYFSGQWQNPFNKKETTKKPFKIDEKTQVNVQMMHQTAFFNYFEDPSAQIVILPFKVCEAKNVRPSLMIVLPTPSTNLASWQKKLFQETFQNWLKQSVRSRVDLQVPSFCLLKRYDLQSALTTMGMSEAFTQQADFSSIDGMKDLFLSKAIHESYFNFNEAGVEATAATAAALNMTAVGPSENPIITFNANRPFLFFLIDETTGTLLFMGKFSDPSLTGCE